MEGVVLPIPYYGAFGLAFADRSSEITAVMWDINGEHKLLSSDQLVVEHTYPIPFVFLPIPILAGTEGEACKLFTEQLVNELLSTP